MHTLTHSHAQTDTNTYNTIQHSIPAPIFRVVNFLLYFINLFLSPSLSFSSFLFFFLFVSLSLCVSLTLSLILALSHTLFLSLSLSCSLSLTPNLDLIYTHALQHR